MTDQTSPPFFRAPVAVALSLLLLAAGAGGCAGKPGANGAELRLTCTERNSKFSQKFDRAYVSKSAEGNTQVVLVTEPGDAATLAAHREGNGDDGLLVQPAAVRQVMHLKILWRPQRGTKQSHPSYTNAGIHWYVFDEPRAGRKSDVLEYTGAGFVALSDTPLGTQVTIRNASIKPAGSAAAGPLADPIGPAKLTGTFFATKSADRVNELLSEVKLATGSLPAEQASAR